MIEVGFARRVAPAVVLAAAGGLLLYLLPSGADTETLGAEGGAATGSSAFPTAAASGAPAASPAAPAASPGSSGGSGTSAGNAVRVIQGDAINFRFGTVQVKIAVKGKTLVDIATITAPGGGYQQYTDLAIPTMKSEILAAQSTKVAAASGATYTSRAYAQSVQSALDKA